MDSTSAESASAGSKTSLADAAALGNGSDVSHSAEVAPLLALVWLDTCVPCRALAACVAPCWRGALRHKGSNCLGGRHCLLSGLCSSALQGLLAGEAWLVL
jgi:hypothetical protein